MSGQIRSGQVRSGQVRSGQVRSGQVRSGQVRSGHSRGHMAVGARFFLQSSYWMKHFSIRLAVINVCPVLVPSELLLSTHLSTSEGWTAELTIGLWLVVPMTRSVNEYSEVTLMAQALDTH